MASFESKLICKITQLMGIKNIFDKALDSENYKKSIVEEPPSKLVKQLNIEVAEWSGRKVFTLSSKGNSSGKHILYLHGGGYVLGFDKLHWAYMHKLIEATGCTIVAPDYPLAPEATYIQTYEMLIPIYSELIDRVGCEQIILMGDSAGGGLTLGLAQKRVSTHGDCAEQLILLSPWLDFALDNPEIESVAKLDPFLSITGLRRAAKAYSGGMDLDNYLLSPIKGSVEGLNKISLFIGTHDLFEPDVRLFTSKLKANRIECNDYVYPEMMHVWMLFDMPESKDAFGKVTEVICS